MNDDLRLRLLLETVHTLTNRAVGDTTVLCVVSRNECLIRHNGRHDLLLHRLLHLLNLHVVPIRIAATFNAHVAARTVQITMFMNGGGLSSNAVGHLLRRSRCLRCARCCRRCGDGGCTLANHSFLIVMIGIYIVELPSNKTLYLSNHVQMKPPGRDSNPTR